MSKDKNFCLIFSTIFGFLSLFYDNFFLIFLCLFFFTFAFIKPNLMHLLNYLVFRIGRLFLLIVNPIIASLLFYVVFGFFSLLLKIFRHDPLLLKNKNKKTYWLDCDSKKNMQNKIENLKNQF